MSVCNISVLGKYVEKNVSLECFEDVSSVLNPSNAEAPSTQSTRTQRFFENHLKHVMLVFIG